MIRGLLLCQQRHNQCTAANNFLNRGLWWETRDGGVRRRVHVLSTLRYMQGWLSVLKTEISDKPVAARSNTALDAPHVQYLLIETVFKNNYEPR
ncbi:uncharacterized protein SPSK_08187 [Sporothrix schenckii 1099-18]|uniref:Uncharacterized protein n=1 Tax=Sporothrix schenckii 1099-18 TaxID=1397361 RepID=A0A0F2MFP7_SPOSC|nr:uncharacterized protein SPSK_08187 [Sporothrix schenckii 1099-18]KJR88437.1 hypothetical protein SPSK_08187 [Sporothrix schenckii 1099-18]